MPTEEHACGHCGKRLKNRRKSYCDSRCYEASGARVSIALRGPYEPTPEEIAATCATIRAGWSDVEFVERHWQAKSTPWDVPRLEYFGSEE